MKSFRLILLIAVLGLTVFLPGCTGSGRKAAGSLVVYADVSLQDRLQAIAENFSETEDVTVQFQYGESSQLAQEIKDGAHADLLILSGEPVMKDLYKQKWIDNYLLFAFSDSTQDVYSMAKPMDSPKYRNAQRLVDAILAQHTKQVTGTNPNL